MSGNETSLPSSNVRDTEYVRSRVGWFAEQMVAKLTTPKNMAKGDWRNPPENIQRLFDRLNDEVEELDMARLDLNNPLDPTDLAESEASTNALISECCDVAAFAMMIADLAYQKQKERTNVPVIPTSNQ